MIKALSKHIHCAFVAAALALPLAACSHNFITEPKPLMLDTEIDYGPPEYRAGYYDGCHSALGAYGNNMMRSMYGVHKRAEYADNRMYNQVWKDAWNYCYMWIFVQRADGDSLL